MKGIRKRNATSGRIVLTKYRELRNAVTANAGLWSPLVMLLLRARISATFWTTRPMFHGMSFVYSALIAQPPQGKRLMGSVVLSEDNFDREVQGHCGPAVVLCGMPWLGTTHLVRRVIDNFVLPYEGRVKFGIVDSLECARLWRQYSLNEVTLLFFREGKLIALRQGIVSEDDVRTCIEALLAKQSATSDIGDVTLHL